MTDGANTTDSAKRAPRAHRVYNLDSTEVRKAMVRIAHAAEDLVAAETASNETKARNAIRDALREAWVLSRRTGF